MRGLRIVSYAMAGAALTLSVLYLGPAVLVQRSGVGPQVTLVQIIDEIEVEAIADPIGARFERRDRGGGALRRFARTDTDKAATAWMFYGLLLLLGAIFLEPPAPVLTGTISIWAAVMHWGMSRAWAEQGVR